MIPISIDLNQARSIRAAFAGLRVRAVAASISACALLAGCAPDMHAASDASPWAAVGNNGGKDRYAVGRAATSDASVQVASAPAKAAKSQ
jgi:hypothetical protein